MSKEQQELVSAIARAVDRLSSREHSESDRAQIEHRPGKADGWRWSLISGNAERLGVESLMPSSEEFEHEPIADKLIWTLPAETCQQIKQQPLKTEEEKLQRFKWIMIATLITAAATILMGFITMETSQQLKAAGADGFSSLATQEVQELKAKLQTISFLQAMGWFISLILLAANAANWPKNRLIHEGRRREVIINLLQSIEPGMPNHPATAHLRKQLRFIAPTPELRARQRTLSDMLGEIEEDLGKEVTPAERTAMEALEIPIQELRAKVELPAALEMNQLKETRKQERMTEIAAEAAALSSRPTSRARREEERCKT